MCHHFAGLIALDTLDVGRFTFYVGRGFTRRGGGAENTAFKTRVPENKGPDAGNYSAASREYHRLRNMLGITLGRRGGGNGGYQALY